MKKRTKLAIGIVLALVAVMVPVMAIAGWYPDRPLKKYEGPNTPAFDHVTFNSWTDTPSYGFEPSFFDGKQSNDTGAFKDKIVVTPGQELTLRTYVHNGAAPGLSDAAHNYVGIARNTKVKIDLPTGIGTKMNAVSQVSASNAQPGSVFDTVDFVSADGKPFKLSYVAGSAFANTHSVAHMPLSDNIVSSGALIGETAPDGNVPSCFEYAQIVAIKVKVEPVNLQIKKMVSKTPDNFVEQVDAQKGDKLYFKISFKNGESTRLDDVVLTDKLPGKLAMVPGTMKLYNSNYPNGFALPDNALFTAGGQRVGDYNPNGNGYVIFQVQVKENDANALVNVACVRSKDIPYDTCDDAKVVTPKPPVQECLPGIPVGDSRCNPTPETPVTPETPTSTTLPETGVGGMAGVLGMTGISAGVHAYRKSRQAVKAAASKSSK